MKLLLNNERLLKTYDTYNIPENFNNLIIQYYEYRYKELYEKSNHYSVSLEEVLGNILNLLEADSNEKIKKFRYFCMSLILCLTVQPTVKAYLNKDRITRTVLKYLLNFWLFQDRISLLDVNHDLIESKKNSYQALDEALDVYQNSLQIFSVSDPQILLLESLQDCLEGYAVFPGSQERRELFNWWLLEVVPSVFCGVFPQDIYTVKKYSAIYQLRSIRNIFWEIYRENKKPAQIDCENLDLLLGFIAGTD